jgi:hypothetical protein
LDWLTAITTKCELAPDHILIWVNNREYAERVPHPDGSGEIKYNTILDLYSVFRVNGRQQIDDLEQQEVTMALEDLAISNSSWI